MFNFKGFVRGSLIGIFIAVLLLEAACRAVAATDLKLAHFLNYWKSRAFSMQVDGPTGSILHQANTTYTQLNPETGFIHVTSDSLGLRNHADLSEHEIMVIGDSFVDGFGVKATERFTDRLAQRLGKAVYAFGAANSAPPQQLDLLKRLIPNPQKYPETVLWFLYSGNDVYDTLNFLGRRKADGRSEGGRKRFIVRSAEVVMTHLYSVRLLYLVSRLIMQKFSVYQYQGERLTLDGREFDFYFHLDDAVGSEALERGTRAIFDAVRELATDLKTQGKKLVLVYIPSKVEAFADALEEMHGISRTPRWDLEAKLLNRCEVEGWNCLSLKRKFQTSTAQSNILYFHHDEHWNPAGHELAAAEIHRYVSST